MCSNMFVAFLLLVAVACAQDCGKTPVPPDLLNGFASKIVGGKPAKPYSWPWQAAICRYFDGLNSTCDFMCGGSLIAPTWVMTAGHCVYGYEYFPKYYGIKLGTYKYDDLVEEGEVYFEVEKIFRHPSINVPKLRSRDIALLKLKGGPVNYTDHIQPVCIPKSVDGIVSEGKLAYVTGWEGGELSVKLRQAIVPFLDMSHCEREYPNRIDNKTMECAGRKGVDSCQGDSGGPLVTMHDDNQRWYQAGIASFGDGCAEENHAGVYQRPSSNCDYIKEVTGLDICI